MSERGAVMVEYGMVLLVVVMVLVGLVGILGGQVLDMFQALLDLL